MKYFDWHTGAHGLLLILASACGAPTANDEQQEIYGPTMRPGWNCLSCHREGNTQNAPTWTAAGTVFPAANSPLDEGLEGVSVVLTGANGAEVRLVTNTVGNFYTGQPLASPFTARLEYGGRRKEMPFSPPAGSCNACHAMPPLSEAPGRIFAP
jgi:hypothetical protein